MTPAQLRVLEALVDATMDGWPASVRDVMRGAGLYSPATAHEHLMTLRARGHAEQHPRRPCGGWLPTADAVPLVVGWRRDGSVAV